jgi:hypothetical protein
MLDALDAGLRQRRLRGLTSAGKAAPAHALTRHDANEVSEPAEGGAMGDRGVTGHPGAFPEALKSRGTKERNE